MQHMESQKGYEYNLPQNWCLPLLHHSCLLLSFSHQLIFNSGKAALESHMHDIKFVSKTLANSSLSKSSALFRMLVPQLFTKISNSLQGSFPINSWHFRRLREEFVSNDGKRSRMVSAGQEDAGLPKSESSTLIDTYWHHVVPMTLQNHENPFKLGCFLHVQISRSPISGR